MCSVLCQFFILGSVHDMILMKIFGGTLSCYGNGSIVNPMPLCKPLPGIANLIALMSITKICSAYNNPVREGKSTYGKKRTWCLCVNISHSSCYARYIYTDPGVLDHIQ